MRHRVAAVAAVLLPASAWMLAGCSANMNRQLESISVTPATASGAPVRYIATGTFSAPPTTVTPLAVSWYLVAAAIAPSGRGYTLVKADFTTMRCAQANPVAGPYTVIAVAPADPSASKSGSMPSQVFNDLVIEHTKTSEGGFVAGTAKLNCE